MSTNYKEIYSKMFNKDDYNVNHSVSYQKALNFMDSKKIDSVLDVGSGKGHMLNVLLSNTNIQNIFSCDLKNFHGLNVPFFEVDLCEDDLENKLPITDCILCLDVLEHLEEKNIQKILSMFAKKTKYFFATIANHSDIIDGIELHLIQKNENFWNQEIEKYFEIVSFEKHYNDRLLCYGMKSKNNN